GGLPVPLLPPLLGVGLRLLRLVGGLGGLLPLAVVLLRLRLLGGLTPLATAVLLAPLLGLRLRLVELLRGRLRRASLLVGPLVTAVLLPLRLVLPRSGLAPLLGGVAVAGLVVRGLRGARRLRSRRCVRRLLEPRSGLSRLL